jgi:BirA family transcriptional regulator, biotin operon repressor / biotin---[acetyl-CoA-carboxylase] ligase
LKSVPDFDWTSFTVAGIVDRTQHLASLGSTNDYLREIAPSLPRQERLLVVADEQTAGRGRGTNRWWTASGSLACSLLFDPWAREIERRYYPMISLAAAIAIAESAEALLSRSDVGLHWPNDVFVAGRKLAGVLIEVLSDGRHVLGIGCNVNNGVSAAPPELSDIVTSLVDLNGQEYCRGEFLRNILERLKGRLDELARSPHTLGRRANELCLQHGQTLTIRAGQHESCGVCTGISDDGALVLETPRGRQLFYSGVLAK